MVLSDRILAKLVQDAGCWIWTGSINHNGYGHIRIGSQVARVHRIAFELWNGPIPDGHHIDHVQDVGCHSRACCNPFHLEAVTQAENNRRAAAWRRSQQREFGRAA